MRTEELFSFVKERHDIYINRFVHKLSKPWTKDKILQNYRFCNVYRELDTQTQWLNSNWGRHQAEGHYWFACLVFRLINWNETAEELGYPVPWKHENFVRTLNARKAAGKKVYSGAYMISTHGVKEDKASYLGTSLSLIWRNRNYINYKPGEDLQTFYERLKESFDVGTFLAAQVVADMKFRGNAKHASDWYTFVAPGPGSKRGLNRVMGRDPKFHITEAQWMKEFREIHSRVKSLWKLTRRPELSAQNLQNCLCEFDKYERVRLGEGRPKARYNGEAECSQ